MRLIKRGDGGSNKIIGAWGGGDRWVIIKLPDPVVPARVVTASEVALMEFVRTELGILTPKVLKWSWDAGGPVGAEYVIMEEVEEEVAGVRWPEIGLEGKARALKELLVVDEKFLRSSDIFGDVGYGSLYFTEDAEKLGFKKVFEVKSRRSPGRFCLGPLAERHFWVDAAADIDRGPCQYFLYMYANMILTTQHLLTYSTKGPPLKPTSPPLQTPPSTVSLSAVNPPPKPNPSSSTAASPQTRLPLPPILLSSSTASIVSPRVSFIPPSPHPLSGTVISVIRISSSPPPAVSPASLTGRASMSYRSSSRRVSQNCFRTSILIPRPPPIHCRRWKMVS